MKQRLLNVIYIFLVLFILGGFYLLNEQNYIKLKQIESEIVKHPELLPNKQTAKYTSFGYSNLRADIYWLETIQYIGGNAMGSEYKKYLFSMLDLITELNPYFEKPYLVGQLLLPTYNERYENLSQEKKDKNIKQAESIGLKGIQNFCDAKKIELIKNENDLQKIWSDEKYKNPCKTSEIPFSQAFVYYFYIKNPLKSANFYKIASANRDSLEGAKIMAAIMSGKSGNRERSIMMFLTLANSTNLNKKENEKCRVFSTELQKVSYSIYREQTELTGDMVKKIEDLRKEYFQFNTDADKKIISGDNCDNYINKAIRELNLAYIENGNKKYLEKNGKNAQDAKVLFKEGYIKFLPTDFQQYGDYGIIYYFNDETQEFDYKMGNY